MIAEIRTPSESGRPTLFVAGVPLAVEGGPCLSGEAIPKVLHEAIPPEELETWRIGDWLPPLSVVREKRGNPWTRVMLEWVALEINMKQRRAAKLLFPAQEHDTVILTGFCRCSRTRIENLKAMIATVSPPLEDGVAAIKVWPIEDEKAGDGSGKLWFPVDRIERLEIVPQTMLCAGCGKESEPYLHESDWPAGWGCLNDHWSVCSRECAQAKAKKCEHEFGGGVIQEGQLVFPGEEQS
jgi:hypothetical protein